MKHLGIKMEQLRKTFDDHTLFCLAIDCIENLDTDELNEDILCSQLKEASDKVIISNNDKWKVIEFYSSPKLPIDIFIAINCFITDLYNCIIID